VSKRQFFDNLSRVLRFSESWIVSSMPRGGLQIVQPANLGDFWLKPYTREFHAHDAVTWRAIIERQPVRAEECYEGGFENSQYYRGFVAPGSMRYFAAAPLKAPLFSGYAGALHVYRAESLGPFTDHDLKLLAEAAREIDMGMAEMRAARLAADSVLPSDWPQRPAARQFAFDHQLNPLIERNLSDLDSRVGEQVLRDAQSRLAHQNGSATCSPDRLAVPDSVGDLWTFRVAPLNDYPALGKGPVVFYCLEPHYYDWQALRAADVAADGELSRLIPAVHFMQAEFQRGPTLQEIARCVHLSPFHFHRRYTELFGITPKHFLLECQIFQAKKLLIARDRDLVDIANVCGFAHQSHFTSRFKQATGLTPTRWRKFALKTRQPVGV
jgi:AraC-like DNA-binding protein